MMLMIYKLQAGDDINTWGDYVKKAQKHTYVTILNHGMTTGVMAINIVT